MDDRKVIYLDDAIDAASEGCQEWRGIFERCKEKLLALPSAQPEIIYCRDCKYSVEYTVYPSIWCIRDCDEYDQSMVRQVKADHYCGYAERREE